MNKKFKTMQAVIAIILAVLTVASPVSIMASQQNIAAAAESQAQESETTEDSSAEDAYVLYEDTSMRDESTKYFRMSDGTVQAAQYLTPVHFEQNGRWVDYDNTLSETSADDDENAGRIVKNKDLVNHTADYSVRLSKKTNGKKFVRLEKDGYEISWYYEDAEKSTAQIEKNEVSDDPTVLENLTSTVDYKNVYKGTDFQYILGPSGIKENIILKSDKSPSDFTSVYKANGLVPVQIDDKTIEMRDSGGKVIYTLTAPFMEDAQGNASAGITLALIESKNNTFTVKTTLDEAWLNEQSREYPVTVDPVLKTEQSAKNVQSAFVSSQNPNKCYKASGTDDMGSLYVGNIYGYGQTESYMKFTELPALGIADKVVDAKLYLGLRKCEVGLPVNVKRLVEDWNEKTVTWNNGPHSASDISDYLMLTEKTDLTKFREVEITDMVRSWYEDKSSNYGLSLTTTKTAAAKAWFYSINYTTYPNNRPVMTVSYRNMSGYEDYWSFTDTAAGRGGTASVNNYNGNLVFSQPVTQDAGGSLMPVNLSLVYNSNKEAAKYADFGNRIQTNYQIYLVKQGGTFWDNGYKYYLNDADGTIHWFYFENGNTSSGKDEDGLGYTLDVISVGSDSSAPEANYVVTDKDDNKMYFDNKGRLSRIKNPSGVSSTVQYDDNSRITSITDGAGRKYIFDYTPNTARQVAGITDPAGRKTEFKYQNGYLTAVSFADGKNVEISWNGSHLIKYIAGIDGTKACVDYDGSEQKRVKELKWCSADNTALESYSFKYLQNETEVTDLQGRSYTYQFNDYAQTTGTVSNTDGSAQFFKLAGGNNTSVKANKLISESRVLKSTVNYITNPGFTRGYAGYWTYTNNSSGASVSIDAAKKNITDASLKVTKSASNGGRVNAVQNHNNLPQGTYTFSAYIYTDGKTIPGGGAQMFAEVYDSNGKYVYSKLIEKTNATNGWERRSVTFDLPAGATLKVNMGFGPDAYGTVWFDDVQLEKSDNASTFNIVENSSFDNGLTAWENFGSGTSSVTWAGLNGFAKCGKLTGSVEGDYKRQRQYLNVSGKKGDVFSYGAWGYAFSAPLNGVKDSESYKPHFEIAIDYYDNNGKWLGCINKYFNPDVKNQWQFLADQIVMPQDYGNISVVFTYDHNVNNAYQTGAFCYKEQYGQTYDYDSNGNVSSVVDLAKSNSTFSYYGNQMAKMLNPSGSKYLYNYNNKKQLTNALSSDGLEYGFSYDNKGNLTKATTVSRKPAQKIESGKEYILINAYSGHAIDSCEVHQTVKTTPYIRAEANYNSSRKLTWTPEAVSGKTDVFYLRASAFRAAYMDVKSASAASGTELQLHAGNQSNAQRFKLVKQEDGSFVAYTEASGFKMCLDGQFGDKEIKDRRVLKQSACNNNSPAESQKWYFYPYEQTDEYTVSTQTEYTQSQNFVAKTTDERNNETVYSYDENKGTLQSVTNANGVSTQYAYDENNNSLLSVSSAGVTNSYEYENDRLQSINVNGALQYSFLYDKFGRTTANRVGNGNAWRTLSELEYNGAGLLSKQTYGNGDTVEFSYDKFDRQTEKRYNGSENQRVTYSYGSNGSVAQVTDFFTGTNTKFVYDLAERVVSQREYAGTGKSDLNLISSTDFKYADKTNYLTGITHFSPLGRQEIGYAYGSLKNGEMPDQVYSVQWNGSEKLGFAYDNLGRLAQKDFGGNSFGIKYAYENYEIAKAEGAAEKRTTTLVKSVETPVGTYSYEYDKLGNIVSVANGTTTVSYEYDSLNQLTRVNDEKAGKTITYSYTNGNITKQKEYEYTTGELGEPTDTKTWSYTDSVWSDLLTDFNGTPIAYDEIGNPLSIGGKQLTWLGRQLQSIAAGENTIEYAYNGDGNRISKTVNGVETEFVYNGDILAGQKSGNDTLVFMYDNNSDVFGFILNGTEYYYIKNAQNDVTAIADKDGNVLVNYAYDAWGKVTEITGNTALAEQNPIRYRSYYFDFETEWYFLNTRYYSPDMCRFISSDDSGIILEDQDNQLEYNLFAYCFNNPVVLFDEDGEAAANIIGAVVGGAVGAGLGYLLAKHLGLTGWKKAAVIAAAAIGGAALGAFLGPYVAKLGGKIASVTKSAASSFKATVRSARTAIKHSKAVTKLINNASKLKRSRTVMSHLSSRPYTNSTLTIQNIMKAGKPMADSSLKNGLKWVVNGAYNGSSGVWELVVDAKTNTIVHFLFRSK